MNRTILVTGSTDGLGRQVALRIAKHGDRPVVHGRSRDRLAATAEQIKARTGIEPATVLADFSSLDAVDSVVDQLREQLDHLDVLINNAGIGTGAPEGRHRSESADGYELRWAVNYLAPFLLTLRALPLLRAGSAPRIVNVASDGQAPVDFNNLMLTRNYSGEQAYCQSKLALIAFGFSLADQLSDITVTSLHPGSFMPTKIVVEDGRAVVDDLEGGIDAVYRLATDAGFAGVTGQYFERLQPTKALAVAYDAPFRRQLWNTSLALLAQAGHPLDGAVAGCLS